MIYAPCDLTIIDNSEFENELLKGDDGIIFNPDSTSLIVPADGVIEFIHPFLNQFVIKTRDGNKITMNIGVETESLYGMGFSNKVVVGQPVSVGDRLVSLDIPTIMTEAKSVLIGMTFEKNLSLKKQTHFKTREEMSH